MVQIKPRNQVNQSCLYIYNLIDIQPLLGPRPDIKQAKKQDGLINPLDTVQGILNN